MSEIIKGASVEENWYLFENKIRKIMLDLLQPYSDRLNDNLIKMSIQENNLISMANRIEMYYLIKFNNA